MGRRKRFIKISEKATLTCPNCSKNTRIKIPEDRILSSFECKKCKQVILTPVTKCCVICAFSNKKCAPSLIMEAKMKNLEIKRE